MSVTSSDIVIYCSENRPTSDILTAGGAIDSGIRATFTDIISLDTVEVSGSNVNDTGNITITGRNDAGLIVTESIPVSGTVMTSGSQNFERILSAITDFVPSGNVLIRDSSTDATIGYIYANESGFHRIFYDATANEDGGATKILYEKVFVKNNNTTTALNNVTIAEVSTGVYNLIEFGLEDTKQNNQFVSNRTNAPTGIGGGYGNAASGLPEDGFLNPLDYQGIWLQLTLSGGAVAQNSFYRLQVNGTTT